MAVVKCNVLSCKHHSGSSECSLNSIMVGNSLISAKNRQETECDSFECC